MRTTGYVCNFASLLERKEDLRKKRLLEIYSSLSKHQQTRKVYSGEFWMEATKIFNGREMPLVNSGYVKELDLLSKAVVPQLGSDGTVWRHFGLSNTHHSTSIEGNTFSERDIEVLFDSFGSYSAEQLTEMSQQDFRAVLQPDVSKRECREVLYHLKAFQLISTLKQLPLSDFNETELVNLHAILLGKKEKERWNVVGFMESTYRLTPMRVRGSATVRPYPQEVPAIMKSYFEWFHSNREKVDSGAIHPVSFSILAHCKFLHIHPFHDGNGRTARLLMNMILNRYGLFGITVHKESRAEYMELLEEHQQGNVEPQFFGFADHTNYPGNECKTKSKLTLKLCFSYCPVGILQL